MACHAASFSFVIGTAPACRLKCWHKCSSRPSRPSAGNNEPASPWCFGFVKRSAGHIEAYSEVGIGTTLRLYLPRTDEAPAEAEPARADPLPRGHETVLAVKDNDGVPVLRDLDGSDLARSVRTLRTEMKVLFTSGFPEAAFGTSGALPPEAVLLGKPLSKDQLAQRLRVSLAA
jgi:hypothetical protein